MLIVLDARKLVAIDLVFLGAKVIIVEFAIGILFSAALGVFVLLRGHGSLVQVVLGLYLISIGINYVPMLIYAIAITKANSARAELGSELDDKGAAMAKYRRQSLWLLVPLSVPVVVITQTRKRGVNDPTVG